MTDEKSLSTEIKCKKLEKSMLNYTTIKVSVINPKTVDGGFLGSNYILYEVRTDKMDWSVRRRYSHFEQLRNILVKSFPGHLVPPLPSKKVGSRRFEDSFVGKRMKFLEKFLVSVCENEIYKTSEALIAFLSFNDRQMFENKMKELNNILPPLYIEDIKTFEGKVKVIDQDDNEKYFSNISRYFVLQNQVLDRLNGNLKNYHMNIKSACGNLVEIQKDFDTLVTLNSRVMMVIVFVNHRKRKLQNV